jgi:hypothetical protein
VIAVVNAPSVIVNAGSTEGSRVTGAARGVSCLATSCVAAGVGSCGTGECSVAVAIHDSGCEVCGSTMGAADSGAENVGAVAAGAAPGRRRAALGANFLPVVFLLMKELKVAATGAGALSLPAAGGCVRPSSADMVTDGLLNASV